MKTVLVTGASGGIGSAVVERFLAENTDSVEFLVIGLDAKPASIVHPDYVHYEVDLRNARELPDIDRVNILINNAGSQGTKDDIDNNLKTAISVTEKYAFQPDIESVLFNASASAHTGFEFAEYSASKAGILGYARNAAWRLARDYKATCNSISCGGVTTELNTEVMTDEDCWEQIMAVTPLKKWATADEIAEWIYFLTVVNKSCTGQDILVDNGEKDLNCTFVWPGF